jgi:hypothetical protein
LGCHQKNPYNPLAIPVITPFSLIVSPVGGRGLKVKSIFVTGVKIEESTTAAGKLGQVHFVVIGDMRLTVLYSSSDVLYLR